MEPETSLSAAETPEPTTESPGPCVLRGIPVAPGLGLGPARRLDVDLARIPVRRVARDQVERELNRFHRALTHSRRQLEELRQHLAGSLPEDQAGLLDSHVAYLRDSVFLTDVENLVLGEQLALEAAIAKVILDFDRIFRLVENEVLRERAVDLRDVGIRVLRSLEREGAGDPPAPGAGGGGAGGGDHVLVASELSIVDVFNLEGERVRAILTEAGSLTSHAAILARSLRIPTLTGVDGLIEGVRDGDFLIVDATEGTVQVRPEAIVRDQFLQGGGLERRPRRPADLPPAPARTMDGERVGVAASCGNLPEVERAVACGVEIGLYRTELLYLVDRERPSLDALVAHYRSVLTQAGGVGVTFRLLDLDSGAGVTAVHAAREPNPQLGRVGVRALLAREQLLRDQLSAFLRAAAQARPPVAGGRGRAGEPVRLALPKVVDCGELRRVKEVLFEERYAARRAGTPHGVDLQVGVVVETPAAVLGAVELAREADFLIVGLDSLQQYLLAADRDNSDLSASFERLHPIVVRALARVFEACGDQRTPLSVFGAMAAAETNLALLLGVGLRHFVVAPVALRGFLAGLERTSLGEARGVAKLALRAACPAELAPSPGERGQGPV